MATPPSIPPAPTANPAGASPALPPATILAVAPFIGSVLTFAYEVGYGLHFGVPLWLVRIDVSHVLAVSLGAALFSIWLYNVMTVIPHHPWWMLPVLVAPSVLAGFIVYILVAQTVWVIGTHLLLPVLFIMPLLLWSLFSLYGNLIRPIRSRPIGTSRRDALTARALELAHQRGPTASHALLEQGVKSVGPGAVFLAVTVIGLLWASYLAGTWRAHTRSTFLVPMNGPQCIAVRRYAESVFCADVDADHKTVRPGFRLLPLSDSTHWVVRNVGPLRAANDAIQSRKLFRPRSERAPIDTALRKLP